MTTEDPRGRPPAVKLIAAPTGRPTLYNEDVAAKICAYLASGYSLPQVAAEDGMPSTRTMQRWRKKHPDFSDDYESAFETRALVLINKMLDIALDATNDYEEEPPVEGEAPKLKPKKDFIERVKIQIDTLKYAAERFDRPRYHLVDHAATPNMQQNVLLHGVGNGANINAPGGNPYESVYETFDRAAEAARLVNPK